MANTAVRQISIIVLELTEEEAEYIKAATQNPLGSFEESEQEKRQRQGIFHALRRVLEELK